MPAGLDAQVVALFAKIKMKMQAKFLQLAFRRKFGSEVDWEPLKAGRASRQANKLGCWWLLLLVDRDRRRQMS